VARLYDVDAVRCGSAASTSATSTLQSLEDVVGYVTQDAHMFHDTIRANLLYANRAPTTATCGPPRGCADRRLVRALPDGLDTVVGDRGYRLSAASGSGWPSRACC
jgi:ATP-binding cassette subfamily B protein